MVRAIARSTAELEHEFLRLKLSAPEHRPIKIADAVKQLALFKSRIGIKND